jgi:hypothetical protein
LAVAGFVALSGTIALAQENIYENETGLMFGGIVPDETDAPLVTGFTAAGPTLNPNGIGQFLMGQYYDVRPVGGDAQHNNLQIINTNTNNTNLPPCTEEDFENGIDGAGCYNPNGGILAKVRFRESKTSREVLDFVIALTCGEVWAARIDLNAGTGLPQITSRFPIVVTPFTNAGFPTRPAFDPTNGGASQSFASAAAVGGGTLTNLDIQRGHIEVIAMEALPCEPLSGDFSLSGGNWARLGTDRTPTNAIGALLFMVRAGSGVSHSYNFAAISRFVQLGGGSIVPVSGPFANSVPDFTDCVASDLGAVNDYSGTIECVVQSNLILSKTRVIAQWDADPGTLGANDLVITFPNKYENCNANGGVWTGPFYGNTPFECGNVGEEAVCTIYDRFENFLEEQEGFISPSTEGPPCRLPREVNIISIGPGDALGDRADIHFNTNGLETTAGWVDIDLARNQEGNVIHLEEFLDDDLHDILGVYLHGYWGLPTLGLSIQEYSNFSVGGTYGSADAPLYEQVILKPGQS